MSSPSSQKLTAVVNAVAYAVMIAANCLSIFLPLNGKTQMQLSAQYPNLITPAGFTFSVWSVIYLLLLGFIIYQFYILFASTHKEKKTILAISPLFVGVALCNAGWLFVWHYEYVTLSIFVMLLMLFLLIVIHERLHLSLPWRPFVTKLFIDIPFSLYLGWICVATIVNITTWFVSRDVSLSFFSPQVWAIIMIIAALLIGVFYVFTRNNIFLALTIGWAFYGIISQRNAIVTLQSHTIAVAAEIALAILLLIVLLNILRRREFAGKTRLSA